MRGVVATDAQFDNFDPGAARITLPTRHRRFNCSRRWARSPPPSAITISWLLWIIAQIPRKNRAAAYRLHDDGSQGFTLCDSSVLTTAVESRINNLPGVVTSAALLRGTARAADLSLRVTVNDRADVQDLIHRIQTSTLPELSSALEAPLQRSQLQIDVSGRTQSTGTVVHSTGTVLQ